MMCNTVNILCVFVFGAFGLFCEGFIVPVCLQKKKASGSNEVIPGFFLIKNNLSLQSSLRISVTSSVVYDERNNDSTIQTNNDITDGRKEIIVLSPFEESIKNQFELLDQKIEQHQKMQTKQDQKIVLFEATGYDDESAFSKLSKKILKVESTLNNKIKETITEINDRLAKQEKTIEQLESKLNETIDDIKQLRPEHKSTYREQSITFRNIKIISKRRS
jgi:uncharacterized coiled-coil protein SlyX